jgi:hypothetical protein
VAPEKHQSVEPVLALQHLLQQRTQARSLAGSVSAGSGCGLHQIHRHAAALHLLAQALGRSSHRRVSLQAAVTGGGKHPHPPGGQGQLLAQPQQFHQRQALLHPQLGSPLRTQRLICRQRLHQIRHGREESAAQLHLLPCAAHTGPGQQQPVLLHGHPARLQSRPQRTARLGRLQTGPGRVAALQEVAPLRLGHRRSGLDAAAVQQQALVAHRIREFAPLLRPMQQLRAAAQIGMLLPGLAQLQPRQQQAGQHEHTGHDGRLGPEIQPAVQPHAWRPDAVVAKELPPGRPEVTQIRPTGPTGQAGRDTAPGPAQRRSHVRHLALQRPQTHTRKQPPTPGSPRALEPGSSRSTV